MWNELAIANGAFPSSPVETRGISVHRMLRFQLEPVPWKRSLNVEYIADVYIVGGQRLRDTEFFWRLDSRPQKSHI